MFEKFFSKPNIKTETSETEKTPDITEQLVNESMQENPEGFMGWFLKLKDSISDWPEKFLSDKNLKRAIIYASIPFAVLQATERGVKAEDVAANISPAGVSEVVKEGIGFNIKNKRPELEMMPNQLVAVEDDESKNKLSERINAELFAFDNLSDALNDVIKDTPDLFPQDVVEKVSTRERIFDFSGNIRHKIEEADQYALEMSSIHDPRVKQEKRKSHINKIFDNGRLNFEALVRTMPEIVLAQKISVLAHERGHEKEAMNQGADSVSTKFNLFGGYTEYYGNVKNEAAFNVAGINADKEYGEFLVNNLRGEDAPSQFLAIMALVSKSDGPLYAISTNFTNTMQEHKGNDIIEYSKNTGTSVQDLALGMAADFLLDRDNWNLMKIALGEEGIKLPETTVAPFYELGEHGPVMGIKIKGVF